MILFALRCAADHHFDGWFRDGAAFDKQSAAGKIACPQCGDRSVAKAPMAPRVARSRDATTAPSPSEVRKALVELRRQIETNFENVGERFAEEARRIHYGESDQRGIYGEASAEDARDLAEEGIEVQRVPWLPRTDA